MGLPAFAPKHTANPNKALVLRRATSRQVGELGKEGRDEHTNRQRNDETAEDVAETHNNAMSDTHGTFFIWLKNALVTISSFSAFETQASLTGCPQ